MLHNHYPEIQLNKYDHKILEKVGKISNKYYLLFLVVFSKYKIKFSVKEKKQNIEKYWEKSGNLVSLEKWELDNRQRLVNFYSLAQMDWWKYLDFFP